MNTNKLRSAFYEASQVFLWRLLPGTKSTKDAFHSWPLQKILFICLPCLLSENLVSNLSFVGSQTSSKVDRRIQSEIVTVLDMRLQAKGVGGEAMRVGSISEDRKPCASTLPNWTKVAWSVPRHCCHQNGFHKLTPRKHNVPCYPTEIYSSFTNELHLKDILWICGSTKDFHGCWTRSVAILLHCTSLEIRMRFSSSSKYVNKEDIVDD